MEFKLPLHSTMFLLKRSLGGPGRTFQPPLHSTMFLLKPDRSDYAEHLSAFTFHNVSIKTRAGTAGKTPGSPFTFHNVSIKTCVLIVFQRQFSHFTFHNVSIKTRKGRI